MNNLLPITALIRDRLMELGLTRSQFLYRLKYINNAKAHRRLEQLHDGELNVTQDLIARLPDALSLPSDTVLQAIDATRAHLEWVREEADRAAFKPHGIFITERTIPSSIAMCAFSGALRWKRIDFDLTRDPSTFVDQAFVVMKGRVKLFGGSLPYWGCITGFVINHTFDLQVHHDLNGKVVDARPGRYQLGEITFEIGPGRSVLPLVRL